MINRTTRIFAVFLVIIFFTADSGITKDTQDFNKKRNQLIGYMLYKTLPAGHFSHKKMDESLSREIFGLYLKQLDYQKRFLLNSDVTELHSFAPHISDNLEHGTNILPKTGYDILKKRIGQVEQMVDHIMSTGFDVNSEDFNETNPNKIAYAINLKELQDRWRKIMKAKVMYRYLDLVGDQFKINGNFPDEELWTQAKEDESKVNKELFLRLNMETLQNHYDRFFNAMARSFDPHTEYLPPTKREEFDIQMRGNLEGVGATLRDENGFNKVVSIVPGGPAAKQGMLQAEDIILQMEEKGATPVDITDMRPGDAARLIRGDRGTEVLLTVKKPDGTKKVIPIIRDVVQIEDTFVKNTVLEMPDSRKIGYILIPSFYRDFKKTNNGEDAKNVTDDTRKAIKNLAKSNLEGIIIDLRNNGGGSLIDAIDITGLFIKSGPIVQVKSGAGKIQVLHDEDANIEYSGPLVVLVNKFSASASEIVAATLQDYKRAVIVGGDHTYGKGTVQITIHLNKNLRASISNELGDLGSLKLTTQKFYRITGDSTQHNGFTPDITLPSLFQHMQSGEKYLDYSLPWDEIGPVKHTIFNDKPFDMGMIREMSLRRVELDPGLQSIAKEAQKADERNKRTSVSLKLTDMCQRTEASHEEQNIFSSQFQDEQTVLHGDDQVQTTDVEDMKKDAALDWQEELKQDLYVAEAINIIGDMKK